MEGKEFMDLDKKREAMMYMKVLFENTPVKDVMVANKASIVEYAEFSEVEEAFINHDIYYLPVVNDQDQLVGLISQKYLYKTHSPRKFVDREAASDPEIIYDKDIIIDGDSYYSKETLDSYILRSVMNRQPPVLSLNDKLADAIKMMAEKKVAFIVVVDKNRKIEGVLNIQEVMNLLHAAIML